MDSLQDQLWTLGIWTAKPGREGDFEAAWVAFATWTSEHQPGALDARLLRDTQDPRRFFSFGPWEDADAVRAWRETPQFQTFVMQVRELCDDFQPCSLRLVAHITPAHA